MSGEFWTPPRHWQGQVAYVLAGGPSVRHIPSAEMRRLATRRVIAVNSSYQAIPEAPFLYFHDKRWAEWHASALRHFAGAAVTCARGPSPHIPDAVRRMRKDREALVCDDPTTLGGFDSGAQALNLAFHLGAAVAIMIGFDMRFEHDDRGEEVKHHYQDHPVPSRESNYRLRFLPTYEGIYAKYGARGMRLYLATPSAINCIPRIALGRVLEDEESVRHDQNQAGVPV